MENNFYSPQIEEGKIPKQKRKRYLKTLIILLVLIAILAMIIYREATFRKKEEDEAQENTDIAVDNIVNLLESAIINNSIINEIDVKVDEENVVKKDIVDKIENIVEEKITNEEEKNSTVKKVDEEESKNTNNETTNTINKEVNNNSNVNSISNNNTNIKNTDNSSSNSSNNNNSSIKTNNSTTSYQSANGLLSLVNSERSKVGVGNLSWSSTLEQAAKIRAKELTQSFSHTRPDGSSCFTVSSSAHAENIAMGQRSVESVNNSWTNSSGHYKNMVNSSYKTMGAACYVQNGQYYWVELFGY